MNVDVKAVVAKVRAIIRDKYGMTNEELLALAAVCQIAQQAERAELLAGAGSTGAPTEEAVNHAVNVLDSYAAIRHSFSIESRRRMAREVLLAALPSGPLAQPTPEQTT